MADVIQRHCPACNALVVKRTQERDEDGEYGLFLKGRSFRLHGDTLRYNCPKCDHEFSVPLGSHTLTPLIFRLKSLPA